jgi:hypothetical protein
MPGAPRLYVVPSTSKKPGRKSQFVRAEWEKIENVEEKLLALEQADPSVLNDNSGPEGCTPLMHILSVQHTKRFPQGLFNKIKALLGKKEYNFRVPNNSNQTILFYALSHSQQFALAKEILSASCKAEDFTPIPKSRVKAFLLAIIKALPSPQELSQEDSKKILSEMIDLLDFLEKKRGLIEEEAKPCVTHFNEFVKAYKNMYLKSDGKFEGKPAQEIRALIGLYKKAIQGVEGSQGFVKELREITGVICDIHNPFAAEALEEFRRTVRDFQKKHLPQHEGRTVDPIIDTLLDKLSSIMETALKEYSRQNSTPFSTLLAKIKDTFKPICSMLILEQIIRPFADATQAAQAEQKGERGGENKGLLEEGAIQFIQSTIEAVSKEPRNFTLASLKEKIKNEESLGHDIKGPTEKLLVALYTQTVLKECQDIENQVRSLINDRSISLAGSTKKYIGNWLDKIEEKRKSKDGLQFKEIMEFNKAMENLPNLPPELKVTLAALIISLLACAALIATASIAVIPVGAAVMISGGYGITQFFNQRKVRVEVGTIMGRALSGQELLLLKNEQENKNEEAPVAPRGGL